MNRCFAGLDWAAQTHAVCVIDEHGAVRRALRSHARRGRLARAARRAARRRADAAQLAVAIERPSGLLVDTLMEAGYPVVPIHPNVVKATRPRYRSHGAKSDASDAYLLADLLRTDGARFEPLQPQSDAIRALRALVRGRDDLVATRVQLANQLRSLLDSFWPGAAAIFAEIDSPIALAFVQRYPTPAGRRHAGREAPRRLPRQHRYCGRRSPAELARAPARRPDGPQRRTGSRRQGRTGAQRSRAPSSPWSTRSPSSPPASSTRSPNSPTGSIVMSLAARRTGCAPPRSSPSSAMCASATPATTQLAAEAGVGPADLRIGQAPQRRLPLGLQPSLAPRRHLLRR